MSARPLELSIACWDYDRTRRVLDGEISARGIELHPLVLAPEETFFRMLSFGEFDVAEMSLSSYVMSLFAEEPPFIAIPIFPSRVFRHSAIYVRGDSEITDAAQLRGAVVGIPEYQMTASVWIRGILSDHHDVPASSVHYRTGGLHDAGRTEKLKLDLPEAFDVQPIKPDATLDGLLLSGEIDALYTARAPRSYVRDADDAAHSRRLFADPMAAEQAYFTASGIFPIMHTLVIRRDVYTKNPWIARSLQDAFTTAKNAAYAELSEVTALKHMHPWGAQMHEQSTDLMGSDLWPYGLAENRHTVETFLRYSHEQGLSPRRLAPEDLFAPEACSETLI